jgi:hypothetical protein
LNKLGARVAAAQLAWLILCVAGCGGGGGDVNATDGAFTGAPLAPPSSSGGNVTISGKVTFDRVPSVPGLGLDYLHTVPKPARGVSVELRSGATVLATTVTDAAGAYSFSVAPNLDVALRVRAEMVQSGTPGWDFRVLDNTQGDALYVLAGTVFNTGTADATRDLNAPSGWGGASYTGARSAAPFAILDVVYDAVELVRTAAPSTTFPPLRLFWSTSNRPAMGANGAPDPATGEIGTSFFTTHAPGGAGIFLLGAANDDTDEYDRHVIAHEWGHYLETMFSRSDSIGGPHALGDQLDMRVAFGEGWGNAFSAMATASTIYSDSGGTGQRSGFAFDIEGPAFPGRTNPAPGWYSEESLQELLYDLFDAHVDAGGDHSAADDLALGFGPIFAVLTDKQRTSVALTSAFPFLNALRADRPADAAKIDALAAAQGIAKASDDYGSAETTFGDPETSDFTSVYSQLAVNGPAVNVCSLDDFSSDVTDSVNKLGSRRFLRLDVPNAGTHTFPARATGTINGAADPDMVLHRAGEVAISDGAPAALCSQSTPAQCSETFTQPLTPGAYVLEVYEWSNTNSHDDSSPPLGRTCFDVTVTSH